LNNPKKRRTVNNMSKLFKKLSSNITEVINACDYDIEGSTLGYNIINYLCNSDGNKKITRMKFSSLTQNELIESFQNRKENLDGNYYAAGITRHIIDFIWGVNLTRALSVLARKHSGFHSTISIGRVQGPTLKFIVDKEREIQTYVPAPYWEVEVYFLSDTGDKFKAAYAKNPIDTQQEVNIIDSMVHKGSTGVVKDIKFRKRKYLPPAPFNLTDLQSEAYINFGFKPSRTLSIAEQLYLDALITYPRTSSQKYPKDIDHTAILSKLMNIPDYNKIINSILKKKVLSPREGKKTDPAHPAIFPTGETPSRQLRDDEQKLYDLIVRRYIASFYHPVELKSVSANIDVNGFIFILRGRTIEDRGWLVVYGKYSQISENQIPNLNIGDEVIVDDILIMEKYTKPPRRYTQRSLLLQMEKENIGTKATRSLIIDTLYDRHYVTGESVVPTELGMRLIEIMEREAPKIISVDMTRDMELQLDKILYDPTISEAVLIRVVDEVTDIIRLLFGKSKTIGIDLDNMSHATRLAKKMMGSCPKCIDGSLIIIRSKRSGKRFLGCTNYPKCKASMPLPQRGSIRKIGTCDVCGWPKIKVIINRRAFTSCVNIKCSTRKAGA